MSLIDVINEDGSPTGIVKTKKEIHEQGLLHATVHIWIYNSKGEVLLQLRAKNKDSHPGLLDVSSAGHIDTGETPLIALLREVQEEIGHTVEQKNLKFARTKRTKLYIPEIQWTDNEIQYIYTYLFDGDIATLVMQPGEVDALELVPLERFIADIGNPEAKKRYCPHDELYYPIIFDELKKAMKEVHD